MANIIGVKIKGFQSHEDTHIKLGAGLNVITGPSDSGKTAVIRLVRWIAFNEPTGEAYVNQKVGEVEATLELDNGVEITKRRRKGKTSYQLSTIPEPFEKAEVPLEVTQALGITKQSFGDFETALNFAYQLEAPFLISETASAGAKILGKLAGTEAVDVAIKDVAKDTYAARQDCSQAEKDIERIDGQLGAYLDLEDLKEQLEACETIAKEIEANVATYDNMKQLHNKHRQLADALEVYQVRIEYLANVPDLQVDMQNIEAAQARYDKLLQLYSVYSRIQLTIQYNDEQLERTKTVEGLADTLKAVEEDRLREEYLQTLHTQYTRHKQDKENADRALQSLQGVEEAAALLEGLHKTNDRKEQLQKLAKHNEAMGGLLAAYTTKLEAVAGIDEAAALVATIEKDYETLMKLRSLRTRQRLCVEDVAQTTRNVDAAINTLEDARNDLTAAWDGLTVCPLCENPVEGGHVHS